MTEKSEKKDVVDDLDDECACVVCAYKCYTYDIHAMWSNKKLTF